MHVQEIRLDDAEVNLNDRDHRQNAENLPDPFCIRYVRFVCHVA
jgi:hypothetical protein